MLKRNASSQSLDTDQKRRRRFSRLFAVLLVMTTAGTFAALTAGRYPLEIRDIFSVIFNAGTDEGTVRTVAQNIICNVRLPRVLLALFAGAGLAVSGAAFQSVFSNPLAAPDTLGVATGSAFGAVLGILFGLPPAFVQGLALLTGLSAVMIVIALAGTTEDRSVLMIVLSGLVTSALFSALISLVKYTADPQDVLPSITFWMMGAMNGATLRSVLYGTPMIALGVILLLFLRWQLNAASLPDDEAQSLGIPVRTIRFLVILAATMTTASVVSMCGLIGWIGLLVPHAARLICGSDNRFVIPMSALLGAAFLLFTDTAARTLFATEVPVSILTAIMGAPFFIYLLHRRSSRGSLQ